jgi:hypothetical protein
MPRDVEGARAWRAANIAPRLRDEEDCHEDESELLCAVGDAFLSLPVALRRHGVEANRVTQVMAGLLADIEADLRKRVGKAETAMAMRALRELVAR